MMEWQDDGMMISGFRVTGRDAEAAGTYPGEAGEPYGKVIGQHGKAGKDTWETGESIFLLGFLIYQIMCLWDTTMFPLPMVVNLAGRGLGLALIAVKILLYGGYTHLQLIGFAILGGCTVYTLITAGYIHAFVWVVFLAGSREVSFRKILQIYLVVSGAGMLMAGAASMLGVIENLRYVTEKRGIRNSFGFVYTTAFSAHLFYFLLIAFYLKGDRLRTFDYLGAVAAAVLVYHFCNARLDSAEILMTALLFWVGNGIMGHVSGRNGTEEHSRPVSGRIRRLWRRIWAAAAPWFLPFCMAASLVITCAYGAVKDNPSGVLREFDEFTGGRLRMGWQGIEENGIHLFGRNIPMTGFGETTREPSVYFMVDNNYVNLLLRGGVLFAAVFPVLYIRACRRNRHDPYFLYAVAMAAVQGLFTTYLIAQAYNPLLLAAFAECVREPEREYGILEPETSSKSEIAFSGTKKLCISFGPYGSGSGMGMTSESGMSTASGMRQPAFEWKRRPAGRMARRLNERL